MTDLQKQNLISLIKTSAILNAQEREEWLMLLDLMNDKQVGELERILAPKVEPPPPQVVQPPVHLPLKHIVNLPKPAPAPQESAKTFSKFAEHLNKILAEKDLPVGEQKSPLDLPIPVAKPVVLTPKPLPPQAPPPKFQEKAPEKIVNKPVETPKTLAQVLAEGKTAPKIKYDSDLASGQDLAELVKKLEPKPKPAPEIRAGLQNQGNLYQAAMTRQQNVPPPVKPTEKIEPKVEVKAQPKSDAKFTPGELTLDQWKQESHEAVTQQLKAMVGKQDYYGVIFALQKSPLYSAYIDSGLKSLEAGKKFEGLGENYMDKKEFEDFTDMLRELQI